MRCNNWTNERREVVTEGGKVKEGEIDRENVCAACVCGWVRDCVLVYMSVDMCRM